MRLTIAAAGDQVKAKYVEDFSVFPQHEGSTPSSSTNAKSAVLRRFLHWLKLKEGVERAGSRGLQILSLLSLAATKRNSVAFAAPA